MVVAFAHSGDRVAKAIAAHVSFYLDLLQEFKNKSDMSEELKMRGARALFFDYVVFEKKALKLGDWEDFFQCCGSIAVLKRN